MFLSSCISRVLAKEQYISKANIHVSRKNILIDFMKKVVYNIITNWRYFINIMIWRMFAMIQIRPVSDLRNKFTEIENTVKNGAPVYLTKNGYGSMVVMSIEAYSKLTESIEDALDVADRMAEETTERYTHEEMFAKLREEVRG